MPEITGLLLAAGKSRRFGSNKLLMPLAGRALLLHSAAALSPCDRVIAVVRADDVALQALLHSTGIETVINEQADLGMGSSLACGVRASHASAGWCILPADMPGVMISTTQKIVAAVQAGAALAAPSYRGIRGHPVAFHRKFSNLLQTLDGDRGARAIIEEHHAELLQVPVDDAGVLEDIDTPDELARLRTVFVRR